MRKIVVSVLALSAALVVVSPATAATQQHLAGSGDTASQGAKGHRVDVGARSTTPSNATGFITWHIADAAVVKGHVTCLQVFGSLANVQMIVESVRGNAAIAAGQTQNFFIQDNGRNDSISFSNPNQFAPDNCGFVFPGTLPIVQGNYEVKVTG